MERLTYWCENGDNGGEWRANAHGEEIAGAEIDRLAAYEEIGLTSGEVRSLWGEWNAMMSVLNSIGSYDRLRELAEADKDGRVAVLPCKVGDYACWLHNGVLTDCKVHRIQINRKGIFLVLKSAGLVKGAFNAARIGESIFLTREEAEAALKEATHDEL